MDQMFEDCTNLKEVIFQAAEGGTTFKNLSSLDRMFEIVFYYTVRQYAVSFNANGGSAAAGQTVNHGGTAARPANPTRSGYTFIGWNLGTAAYNFDSPVTRDITLIAQWRRNGGTDSGTGNTGGGEYHAAYHHHSRHPDAP